MKRVFVKIATAAAVCLMTTTVAWADTAAEAFAKGEGLLKQGNLDGALAAYADAARAERGNQEYVQHYTFLRRILQLRQSLEQEQNAARWENVARSLHAFYVSEKLYSEALMLDRQIHRKLNSEWSTVTLAETQLALGLNDEAVQTLTGLDAKKASPAARATLGIALARNGQTDRAKEIAMAIDLPPKANPQTVYAAARLSAAVGDSAKAAELLARCIESVPPSRQDGFKELAKLSPEFATMAATAEFAKALDTKSKVPESKCSGGKSCAGCPMRGKCPSSQK